MGLSGFNRAMFISMFSIGFVAGVLFVWIWDAGAGAAAALRARATATGISNYTWEDVGGSHVKVGR